jgi:hypothetical protein
MPAKMLSILLIPRNPLSCSALSKTHRFYCWRWDSYRFWTSLLLAYFFPEILRITGPRYFLRLESAFRRASGLLFDVAESFPYNNRV